MIQTGMEQLQLIPSGEYNLKGLYDTRAYMLTISNVTSAFKLQFKNAPDPTWYDFPDTSFDVSVTPAAHIIKITPPSSFVRISFTAEDPLPSDPVYVNISEFIAPSV